VEKKRRARLLYRKREKGSISPHCKRRRGEAIFTKEGRQDLPFSVGGEKEGDASASLERKKGR